MPKIVNPAPSTRAAEAMMAVIDNKPVRPEKPEKSVPDKATPAMNVETITTAILNVAPAPLLHRLMSSEGNMKKAFWDIGDDTNALWEIVAAHDMPYTKIQVCAAVGKITDRSFNSVWQYASTAMFYPEEVRDEFGVLPYSHFDLARQFHGNDEDGVPAWRKVLEISMDYLTQYGTPPARSTLASKTFALREKSLAAYNLGGDGEKPLIPDFVSQVLEESALRGMMPNEVGADQQAQDAKMQRDLNTLYQEVRLLTVELSSRLQALAILEQQTGRSVLANALAKVIVYVKSFMEAAEVFNGNTAKRTKPVYSYDHVDAESREP